MWQKILQIMSLSLQHRTPLHYSQLHSRVDWFSVHLFIILCSEVIPRAVITKCSPLGVDNYLTWFILITIPFGNIVKALHVAHICPSSQDQASTDIGVGESTWHHSTSCVIYKGNNIHSRTLWGRQVSEVLEYKVTQSWLAMPVFKKKNFGLPKKKQPKSFATPWDWIICTVYKLYRPPLAICPHWLTVLDWKKPLRQMSHTRPW